MFTENLEVIRLLLENGSDPNALSEEDRSPLRFAVEQNSLEMAELFLHYGADKTINDSGGFCGFTALGLAARKQNVAMIALLLKAGADTEAIDTDGETARDHLPSPPPDESKLQEWNRAKELLSKRV
jgi:ankyrin repeat protein